MSWKYCFLTSQSERPSYQANLLCFAYFTYNLSLLLTFLHQTMTPDLPSRCYHAILETVLPILVLDGEVTSRCVLVLVTDKVRDGLIFGLLRRRLVALITLAHKLFLHKIDSLVEHIFILLALGSSTGHAVHLVHEAAAAPLLVGVARIKTL